MSEAIRSDATPMRAGYKLMTLRKEWHVIKGCENNNGLYTDVHYTH